MIKKILLSVIFLGFSILSAQSWEVFNTELMAEKENGEIVISLLNGTNSIVIDADTVYYDGKTEHVFFEDGGLKGILDARDPEIIQPAFFQSLKIIDKQHYIVEVPDGYFFSYNMFPLSPLSEIFEDVIELIPLQLNSCNKENPFIVKLKDKYGIINPADGFQEYLVAPGFDEILFSHCSENSISYYLRSGNKWGAGDCKGIEVMPAFEKIEHVFGDCQNSGYFIWNKGKMGLIMSDSKEPLIDTDYEQIKYVPVGEEGFIFGLNNNSTELFHVRDRYGEVLGNCIFQHLIKVKELGKTYMVYTVDGDDQMQLELSEEAVHKLEFTVEDWIYLGY